MSGLPWILDERCERAPSEKSRSDFLLSPGLWCPFECGWGPALNEGAGQDVPVSRRPRGPRATRKSEGRVRLYTEVQPRLSSKKSRSDFLLSPGLQCPRKRQSGVCVIRGQEVRVCARLYMEGQPSARAYTRLPENRAGLRPLELFLSYVPWQLSCERRPPAFRAPPGPGR